MNELLHDKMHILGAGFTTGLLAGAEPFANMIGAVSALLLLECFKWLIDYIKGQKNKNEDL